MIRPLLYLACCLGATPVFAQTLTTNDQGQRVIVYPDGTTKLFDEAAVAVSPYEASATPQQEADAKEEVRDQIDKFEDELKSFTSIAKKARKREAKLSNRIRKLRESKKSSDRSQVEIVSQTLISAREEFGAAEAARVNAESRAAALRQSLDMSIAQRQTYLAGMGMAHLVGGSDTAAPGLYPPATLANMPDPSTASTAPSLTPAVTSTGGRRGRGPSSTYAEYDVTKDPKFAPPAPTCELESEGFDEFTNNRRVVLAPQVFFTYTSPELKPFLGDASLLTCNARLVKNGRSIILETEFVIRSQFAAKEFGVLARGSQLTLRTVGAQKVVVRNQSESQATYDPITKVSTYRGRYVLSKGTRKALERNLLDEVRVMWGTGFDDYQIYDLTFLQRQLACI